MVYAMSLIAAAATAFALYRQSMWSTLIAGLLNGIAAWLFLGAYLPG